MAEYSGRDSAYTPFFDTYRRMGDLSAFNYAFPTTRLESRGQRSARRTPSLEASNNQSSPQRELSGQPDVKPTRPKTLNLETKNTVGTPTPSDSSSHIPGCLRSNYSSSGEDINYAPASQSETSGCQGVKPVRPPVLKLMTRDGVLPHPDSSITHKELHDGCSSNEKGTNCVPATQSEMSGYPSTRPARPQTLNLATRNTADTSATLDLSPRNKRRGLGNCLSSEDDRSERSLSFGYVKASTSSAHSGTEGSKDLWPPRNDGGAFADSHHRGCESKLQDVVVEKAVASTRAYK
ncbi:hypothetical protein [Candidatus Anaplasma sp. TIGMIC]|uniref:hypothetical protein n=1 Tax=Candidatus Anaplasma sp. TIGMIC TaxID=3020713 RepID=UPI00232BA069|nr:hypothetical protein [Candidatus Anaplasma sp. TIGMIC]MDB1135399.1 hypothetical protein [Candidatus Anaplasma sp. TIGMIC]